MTLHPPHWSKEFRERFCRLDKSPEARGRMENWFLRDDVTGKEVKAFIEKILTAQLEEVEALLPREDARRDMTTENMPATPTAQGWNAYRSSVLQLLADKKKSV